jgi:Tfp pilus assembly protein PilF
MDIFLPNGSLNTSLMVVNAETLLKAGDIVLAKGLFHKVLMTGKLTHLALFGLARCFEAEEKFEKAEALYREALDLKPRYEIYMRFSQFLEKKERVGESKEVLQKAYENPGLSHVQKLELKRKLELLGDMSA